ncbi:MAG: hypothetical protein CMN76_15050 [Spirochaetaceae bacterium]|nr:hypothetical protein [Spirochaetaceae bacterium]|tara:strand:+ start:53409 stop:54185 length:777 start_codon:yes stop_codon:yes gene_type:complete
MRNRASIWILASIQFPFRFKKACRIAILLTGLLLASCFEYEEHLYLAPNYSGYVDYKYRVPLQAESGRSLLAFLPATEETVRQKFGIADSEGNLILEGFKSREMYEPDERFPRQRQVEYRIRFKKPESLEQLLLGQTRVYYLDQRLVIQRAFPTSGGLKEDAGRIAQNFHTYLENSLRSRALKLSITAPWYYNVYANAGATAGPGRIYYNVPLEGTINRKNPNLWRLEIKANPMPEDGPGSAAEPAIPVFPGGNEEDQ